MHGPTIVLELRHTGHTLGFAAEVAAASVVGRGPDNRRRVILALNEGAKGTAQMSEVDLPPGVEVRWMAAGETEYLSAEQGLRELAALRMLHDEFHPERMVVPTADAVLLALTRHREARRIEQGLPEIDMVVHWPVAAQVPSGLSTLREALRGCGELRSVRRHRVLAVDPYAALGPGRWFPLLAGAKPPGFLPHLLRKRSGMTREEARAALGIPSGSFAVVAPGDASPRKASDRLLEAVLSDAWPNGTVAVFAGPVSDMLRPKLRAVPQEKSDRLVVHDRFLEPREFAACFDAADAVWAVTPSNRGISSTFLYAARAGIPAIVAQSHRSAVWMAGRIGVGIPTGLDQPSVLRTIERARCSERPDETKAQEYGAFLDRITDPERYREVVTGG